MRGIRAKLEVKGIRIFMDRENLIQGLPWPQALEQALRESRAVAVFVGPHELSVWQKREMFFALDLQPHAEREERQFPTIAVLRKNAQPQPGFLFLNTWTDFRSASREAKARETPIRAIQQDTRRAARNESAICPYLGQRVFREEDDAFTSAGGPH